MQLPCYPNGINVALQYSDYGYLSHELNAASGYVYREITEQDVWGNMTEATLSDGLVDGNYRYSDRTGQMLTSVVSSNGNDVHDLNYAHLYIDIHDNANATS